MNLVVTTTVQSSRPATHCHPRAGIKYLQNTIEVISNWLSVNRHHAAVRLDHYIVVFAAKRNRIRVISTFNLYTEAWRKYIIPRGTEKPSDLSHTGGVVIRGDIFYYELGALWKLMSDKNGCFAWKELKQNGKTPSPRSYCTAWAYKGNLWLFGGLATGYDLGLHDHGEFDGPYNNKLLQFSTVSEEWTNPKCNGAVPKPRWQHSTTVVGDNVWLFGGQSSVAAFDDLHQLNMCTFTWTEIQIWHTKPLGRHLSTLNAITDSQLVLHAGVSPDWEQKLSDTWIFDLPSQSWKPYISSKDERRFEHTGLPGINGDLIIFSGYQPSNKPCKNAFHIMLEPLRLQHLAMKTLYMHRAGLPWITLPKKLLKLMDLTAKDNTHQN